jgi:hypothetical protein
MGIRETMNRNSALTVGTIVFAIAFCAVVIGMELRGSKGEPPKYAYYTADDGKTWFSDLAIRLPPFDHNGSPAVRCFVFKGPNGEFAGLLEKFSDQTRAKLAQTGDQIPPFGTPILVKRPGESEWKPTDVSVESMMLIKILGPESSGIERVMP